VSARSVVPVVIASSVARVVVLDAMHMGGAQ
jgi:hypothetical protein